MVTSTVLCCPRCIWVSNVRKCWELCSDYRPCTRSLRKIRLKIRIAKEGYNSLHQTDTSIRHTSREGTHRNIGGERIQCREWSQLHRKTGRRRTRTSRVPLYYVNNTRFITHQTHLTKNVFPRGRQDMRMSENVLTHGQYNCLTSSITDSGLHDDTWPFREITRVLPHVITPLTGTHTHVPSLRRDSPPRWRLKEQSDPKSCTIRDYTQIVQIPLSSFLFQCTLRTVSLSVFVFIIVRVWHLASTMTSFTYASLLGPSLHFLASSVLDVHPPFSSLPSYYSLFQSGIKWHFAFI